MKEGITSRVGRIISGSVNALVDSLESSTSDSVMNESIREVESAIDDVRAELGRVIARKHLANRRLMEENNRYESLTENIELAIHESRDDLARAAIGLQLDIEAQIPVLEATIGECAANERELEGYITALRAKRREMSAELKSRREKPVVAVSENGAASVSSLALVRAADSVAKAENAYTRVSNGTPMPAGNSAGSNLERSASIAELDDLARERRIAERLQAITGCGS